MILPLLVVISIFIAIIISPYSPLIEYTEPRTQDNPEINYPIISPQFFNDSKIVSSLPNQYEFTISNDDDLKQMAANEFWIGDGTPQDPFIIENYEITNLPIHNISLSVLIRNNLIGQLELFGSNSRVENNKIHDASPAWIIGDNNIISDNLISNQEGGGPFALIVDGDDNYIVSNSIIESPNGMTITGSNNVIVGNFISKLYNDGLGDPVSNIPEAPNSFEHGITIDGSINQIYIIQ